MNEKELKLNKAEIDALRFLLVAKIGELSSIASDPKVQQYYGVLVQINNKVKTVMESE